MIKSNKILIMGLPGAGKTWFAERLQKIVPDCAWYNADVIRKAANDWDFSPEGRTRQANRMSNVADFEVWNERNVICDFVCPTAETRSQFGPDVIIWIDTIDKGRFDDTNKMFEAPDLADVIHIDKHMSDDEISAVGQTIIEGGVETTVDDDFDGVFGDSGSVPDFIRRSAH